MVRDRHWIIVGGDRDSYQDEWIHFPEKSCLHQLIFRMGVRAAKCPSLGISDPWEWVGREEKTIWSDCRMMWVAWVERHKSSHSPETHFHVLLAPIKIQLILYCGVTRTPAWTRKERLLLEPKAGKKRERKERHRHIHTYIHTKSS